MRNSIFDLPDKDDFIFIYSSICLPIKISHCIEFSSFSFWTPCCHERAMNSLSIHKLFNHLYDSKQIVFNIIQKDRIVYFQSFLYEHINQSKNNVVRKISWIWRDDKHSLDKISQIIHLMVFNSTILYSMKLFFEFIRDVHRNEIFVLPIKKYL